MIIGKHENGVCRIRYDDPTQLLISGSWDASLKLWNPFAEPDQALRHTISLPHKVFAMDTVPIYTGAPTVEAKDPTPRLVVAMAERLVHIYNLRTVRDALDANELEDASKPEQTRESSLKFMLRDVRCMPEGIGYATSSIEGRIAVEFFDPSPEGQAQKYAFKCHRKEVDGEDVVFPIHALAFDPRYGTFATGGGDAHCALWDPVAKKRIRQYVLSAAVSALAFSADGHMLAIATGADNLDEDSAPGEVQVVMKPALEDAKVRCVANLAQNQKVTTHLRCIRLLSGFERSTENVEQRMGILHAHTHADNVRAHPDRLCPVELRIVRQQRVGTREGAVGPQRGALGAFQCVVKGTRRGLRLKVHREQAAKAGRSASFFSVGLLALARLVVVSCNKFGVVNTTDGTRLRRGRALRVQVVGDCLSVAINLANARHKVARVAL